MQLLLLCGGILLLWHYLLLQKVPQELSGPHCSWRLRWWELPSRAAPSTCKQRLYKLYIPVRMCSLSIRKHHSKSIRRHQIWKYPKSTRYRLLMLVESVRWRAIENQRTKKASQDGEKNCKVAKTSWAQCHRCLAPVVGDWKTGWGVRASIVVNAITQWGREGTTASPWSECQRLAAAPGTGGPTSCPRR